jgi:hypothetical protein
MFDRKTRPRERRKRERRAFPHYMQFLNDQTGELVGDLADISLGGFRLESAKPIPVDEEFPFRINLPPGVSQNPSMVFTARSRWSLQHHADPRLYEAGFQIMRMEPADSHAYQLMFDRYGSTGTSKAPQSDYLWGK